MDKLTFTFTPTGAQLMIDTLSQLPYNKCFELISDLQMQYKAQTENKENGEVVKENAEPIKD